jgi:hypothetical protein
MGSSFSVCTCFNTAFQYTISILYFNTPFQYCISILHFNIVFQYTISILHFNTPLQYSISIPHFSSSPTTFLLSFLIYFYLFTISLLPFFLFIYPFTVLHPNFPRSSQTHCSLFTEAHTGSIFLHTLYCMYEILVGVR